MLEEDRVIGRDIERIASLIEDGSLLRRVGAFKEDMLRPQAVADLGGAPGLSASCV
jgi:hypothetical protein